MTALALLYNTPLFRTLIDAVKSLKVFENRRNVNKAIVDSRLRPLRRRMIDRRQHAPEIW